MSPRIAILTGVLTVALALPAPAAGPYTGAAAVTHYGGAPTGGYRPYTGAHSYVPSYARPGSATYYRPPTGPSTNSPYFPLGANDAVSRPWLLSNPTPPFRFSGPSRTGTAPSLESPPWTPPPPEVDPALSTAHITVKVPADAVLWFNGQRTAKKGTDRRFVSPPLTPGRRYTYVLRARWEKNGQSFTQTRRIPVFAGDRVTLEFPPPSGTRDQSGPSKGK